MTRRKHNPVIHYLPVYGCIATGIIYASIGVIAILSFFRLKNGGADENRFFAFLSNFFIGKIIVAIILIGTLCYIVWRFYEAIKDPYGYGRTFGGIVKRSGISLSTVADILIVFSAFRFLAGFGDINEGDQLDNQRILVGQVLQKSIGNDLIIGIGLVYMLTAAVQLFYGVTRGYRERLEMQEFRPAVAKTINVLGICGYFARGIILGITGFFYMKSGLEGNPHLVVDTDKAFDFIGDKIGHIPFLITAMGTICYGIFMFFLGSAYDTDKD